MKTKNLFLCLLFLVLGTTTAWADKYYQPGSYKGNTTPRLTLEQAVGKKFMIYDAAINGNQDRTGFLRNNGVQFELDKSKERDLYVYNENFVYTMECYTDEKGATYYAIKSVDTGLYVNISGQTDIASAADAKLYITAWDDATGKSGCNMESWKYNVIANNKITSDGHGSTVFVVNNGGAYWNSNTDKFTAYSDGHPFAFYEAHEVTTGDYLQDLHIYSRCNIYSAQVIHGCIRNASQITSSPSYTDEGGFANLIDGDATTYNVTDWTNSDEGHYYQIDLETSVSSFYLYMQRRADGKNAPVKFELQASADGNSYTKIGEYTTELVSKAFYTSPEIELGDSYRYLRIVARETSTSGYNCMGLSELYVLPANNEVEDALTYVNKLAETDCPIFTRATAKVYAQIVEELNATCPEAKQLSGVPLPGNKYRIYADAYDVNNNVYVNREIKADGNNLAIVDFGSYNAASEKNKFEWYCEQTTDGRLVFRNVADPSKYLGNGAITDESYMWSISTFGTQRHGVPLMNGAMQYLAVCNDGTYWMGNVKEVQNQTVANASIDTDNNPETPAEVVASGLCTDFVFIPVKLQGEEKKITIKANELVERNTKLLFDADGNGSKEVYPLPYTRMFMTKTRFNGLEMQLLCDDIHKFKGVKVNGGELNTEIATLTDGVLNFDYDKLKDGDVVELQFDIVKPFEWYTDSEISACKNEPTLYFIRNKRSGSIQQQAGPNRASIDVEDGEGPISSQTGKHYYAHFDSRASNMTLVQEPDAASIFYFTKTEDTGVDEYYAVRINNATTAMRCASDVTWNINGNTWYVQPKKTTSYTGYNIGITRLDATNDPDNALCSNHADGDKILRYHATDDGSAWEFVAVEPDKAKDLLYAYITKVKEELHNKLLEKNGVAGIDADKLKYYHFVVETMASRAEGYFNGTHTDGANATAKLLQYAQNVHMIVHEIEYALFELPQLTDENGFNNGDFNNPQWYYIRNVNSDNLYAKYTADETSMGLAQRNSEGKLSLSNLYYFVGEKNSYAPKADEDPANDAEYKDFPGNNLIIDEYLKAHIHNFMANGKTLVSKNVELMNKTDVVPDVVDGKQIVASGLELESDQDWSIELEYDLSGNTAYNAYGSCLLAGSEDPTKDNYAGEFQVYLKDDRSIVIKVNNADDSNRFWHTQDNFSHIKVVITYSQKTVTLDVYNSLGEKETKTIENVTLKKVEKLTSALPETGAKLTNLATYQVEALTWKTHVEAAQKDEWYIMPSSNLDHLGLAIVLGEPNDNKMGWTNSKSDDPYITTDLGVADNSTWKFERVTDFDGHIDELLAMYNFKDCVIYDRELAALMKLIKEKETIIKAAPSGAGEEAAFNEVYYAILNYTGRMPEHLMAPNPGVLYTIRPAVEEFTENALLVHTEWTNNTYTSKEVYLDDVILADQSYDSRAAWVFEGADGSKNSGLKAKNLHTQCYLTALGADASAVNEESDVSITLAPLGGCTTSFKVGEKYMGRNATEVAAVKYIMDKNFWGSAITNYPTEVGEKFNTVNGHSTVHSKTFEVLVSEQGTVTVTFTHELNVGQHKLNILGVTLVDITGKIVASEYRHSTAGGNPTTQTYTLANVPPATYILNCYVGELNGGDNDKLQRAQGEITFTGISKISGTKVINTGTEATKWIVEEIKDPENSVYFNVASLSNATLPDGKAYASLYLGFDAKIPEGITAWIVTRVLPNTQLDMVEVDGGGIVPANTGLILSSESPKTNQKFYYSAVASTFDAEDNILKGTPYTKVVDCREQNVYMLGKKNDRIALYWTYENRDEYGNKETVDGLGTNHNESGYVMCNANKSYLEDVAQNENAVSVFGFSFGGGTTGVDEVSDEVKGDSGNVKTVYDLQGRRLVKVTSPGIYIVDGKKVYVTEIEE